MGRAVRACGDAVRAGWLVLQAIVYGGQEVDCGGYQEEMEPCQQIVYSQMIADPDSIQILSISNKHCEGNGDFSCW